MSDPMTNTDLEDVLASIRRLVSDDKRPHAQSAQKYAQDRLVLTPSLRVRDEGDVTAPPPTSSDAPETTDDALRAFAQAAFSRTQTRPPVDVHGDAVDPAEFARDADDDDLYPDDEARFVNVDDAANPSATAAPDAQPDGTRDISGNAEDDDPFASPLDDHVSDDDLPAHNGAESALAGDDATRALAGGEADDATLFASVRDGARDDSFDPEPDDGRAPSANDAAPDLAAVDNQEAPDAHIDHDGPIGMPKAWRADPLSDGDDLARDVDSDLSAVDTKDAAQAEPPAQSARERAGPSLSEKVATLEMLVGKRTDTFEPDAAGGDAYAGTQAPAMEWEDADEGDDRPVFGAVPGEKPPEDTRENAQKFPIEEDVLDEDALRELISDIVRQELQGALGERITRNVRKLVRREIHRALAAQDLE